MAEPKFQIGNKAKIIKLLDDFTNPELIGLEGTIEIIDVLPNGEYNYTIDVPNFGGCYMHEEELELI